MNDGKWENAATKITRIDAVNTSSGEFPEGTRVGRMTGGSYIQYRADGTVETDGQVEYLIANGDGIYRDDDNV